MNKQIIIAALSLSITGCEKITVHSKRDTGINSHMLSNLLIDTVRLTGTMTQTRLNGKVQPTEERLVHVFPMVSGIAQSVKVQQGDLVKNGQLMAILQSPEVAGFTKDAIVSKTNLNNAKIAMDIGEDLYKTGLSSLKEVEQLRGEYQKALAENRRDLAVLKMNGGSEKQVYEIRSPLSGFVLEKNIVSGTQVRSDNAQRIFTVADLSKVNVVFNIYESDIASIHEGDSVRITTMSYPDKVFEGKIERIYEQLDQESTVMKAKATINNPGFILKPGMFANVEVTGHQAYSLPYINPNTVVFDHNLTYVMVMEPAGRIRIQQIELGKRVENKVFILAGLKPGDRLISSRQVYLYHALKN